MATTSSKVPWVICRPALVCLLLLVIPLALACVWGTDSIDDGAFVAFHTAGMLAHDCELPYPAIPGQPRVASPLWTLVLWAMAELNIPLPGVSLVLGGLGWGVSCVVVYAVGLDMQMNVAGLVSALLLASSPLIVAPFVLATETPWLLCFSWLAVWSTVNGYRRSQTAALVLLLALRVTPLTLTLVFLLLAARIRTGCAFHWMERFLIAGVLALWVVLMVLGLVADPLNIASVSDRLGRAVDLLGESDFYWFALPFAAAGLAASLRRTHGRMAIPLLSLAVLLSDPGVTGAMVYGMVTYLIGTGVEVIVRRLADRALLRLTRDALVLTVGLMAVLPLTVAQTMSLYQSRPVHPNSHQALEVQAAELVRALSLPGERVMGAARVGYLAGRPTLLYEGRVRRSGELSDLMTYLKGNTPDLCVSYRSLGWDDLVRTGWFQNTYYLAAKFSAHYDPLSPIIVWQRRPVSLDLGFYQPLSVRLPDGSAWVGYTYEPDRVAPGQVVSVTLYTHQPPIVAAATSGAEGGQTSVYLRPPGEGGAFAHSGPTSRRPVIDDPEIGLVWAETFLVAPPDDLPVGAYYLSASLLDQDSDSFAHLYQDEITFPIDRVTLGYVVVPWRGNLSEAMPVGATLGAGPDAVYPIELQGYALKGELSPGGVVELTLYWEALGDMSEVDASHFVFVHLLNADGQLVAQHDGPPVMGQYPLAAWTPGEIVPDSHTLVLDPALTPGAYTFQVGIYTWPTLERLPVWDADGEILADGVVVLGEVEVR